MSLCSRRRAHWPIALGVWLVLGSTQAGAADAADRMVQIRLGDYAFTPPEVKVAVNQPLTLELVNADSVTPHNFTLKDADAGLDIDVDVGAGKSTTVTIVPLQAGSYTFHCDKKLPFIKSHRDRGMQGLLVVTP